MRVRGRTALMAAVAAASMSLTVTACGGGGSSSDSNTVTIWSSIDQPVQDGLLKALEAKIKAGGDNITIKWQKVENINQLIITKIQSGDTPDIALVPQPGVVSQMNQLGAIKSLDDAVDMSSLQSSMMPGTLESGTIDGKLYGLLVSANVKGLVFYNKKDWAKKGYDASSVKDFASLESLASKMQANGDTPWCFGIESDTATGWPATDWLETLVMKQSGADAYNSWVAHDIPFDDTVVKDAGAEMEKLLFGDGSVLGGIKSATSTNFGEAGTPMFDSPSKCEMLVQGSFITGFFPKPVVADLDANVGVFGFPPATAGGENPVEGGGDLLTMLNDSANVKKVVGYLSETDIGNDAAPSSSFFSPHKDFDTSLYPNQVTKDEADYAYTASTFLFDGSDSMPAEVGTGSFWKEMTAWISGDEDLNTALKNIQDSWPS
ncbi:ABC transporter substrate-binding protein [Nocardioides sp. LS1]|uniref:ABC transporter substrate-binding protein n=1 Tax=Nocardioides sp. LS1 TaxID=1027620 RepID=UPI000F615EE4|nr:ABC transporter substrate-binding protein [Nocardioides sp. LS1]GCD91231.1 sugar ABC transporter substrate-binding protein [Nocardioides sp. LS1]